MSINPYQQWRVAEWKERLEKTYSKDCPYDQRHLRELPPEEFFQAWWEFLERMGERDDENEKRREHDAFEIAKQQFEREHVLPAFPGDASKEKLERDAVFAAVKERVVQGMSEVKAAKEVWNVFKERSGYSNARSLRSAYQRSKTTA